MLWDPGSEEKDKKEEQNTVPLTPILVPLHQKPTNVEKNLPLLVPDVQGLKDQFQQQQNMLTQIKETIKKNESQLNSKEKQVEVYANKLSQIRARSKNTQGKKNTNRTISPGSSKTLSKKPSKENLSKSEEIDIPSGNSKIAMRGKVSELKKCLEENKIKFEQRTGKEHTETKKIESLVEQLKMQLEERDKTIQNLQKNIDQPILKLDTLSRKTKQKSDKEPVASKSTQTIKVESEDLVEIVALKNKLYELESKNLDLEENLKEKESVIMARTQAVTLLSQDLSLKGKNALENLEETRQEMRTMQNNFVAVEDQLKKELLDRENRLSGLEAKHKQSQSVNFELSVKNAELQKKLVKLQEKYAEVESETKSLKESLSQGQSDERLEEYEKKINVLTKELDDRNKSMIKMRIEHKNKIKNLNKTLEILKGSSDDKGEIIRLGKRIEDLENIKTGLENRVAELEDEKVTEKKLKDQINELEIVIRKQSKELSDQARAILDLEKDKLELTQTNQDQNILIENLYAKMLSFGSSASEADADNDSKLKEINQRLADMEMECNRKLENIKIQHGKEIEMLESYYSSKMESTDRRELEEYRISTEINNIHVEEQIELLIREKQQLLEKLKSLSGVSSVDSLAFEKMEHFELREDKESTSRSGEEVNLRAKEEENRMAHLQKIVSDQENIINELQKTIQEEKKKAETNADKIKEMESTIRHLEDFNSAFKQQIEGAESAESGKNQKSNLNVKNKLKKIEMELTQTKKTLSEQNEKMNDLNEKLIEKEELIKKYTEKIELFEKDDWDRQNHWKNTGFDIEDVQELQRKCLSLENSLLELTQDCERLRKENIEVVHLLSEEKVKRKKLFEELEAKQRCLVETAVQCDVIDAAGLETRINALNQFMKNFKGRVENLETTLSRQPDDEERQAREEDKYRTAELEQKLEWANVVLASKETEIFRIQSLLEDRCKTIEDLESDANDCKNKINEKEKKLHQMSETIKARDIQLEELTAKFNKIEGCANLANEKLAKNETELKELSVSFKEMEEKLQKKELELQEMKSTLGERNVDLTNLRDRLDEVNSDLTYSYQEHMENIGKCLRDKESDYNALMSEKQHFANLIENLVTEKDDLQNQKILIESDKKKIERELLEKEQLLLQAQKDLEDEREKFRRSMSEKEKAVTELMNRLEKRDNPTEAVKTQSQEMEDMKIKMKKLAANLKKKAQNEMDLQKQITDLENLVAEKNKMVEKLEADINEVREKWTNEKNEKEEIQSKLSSEKASADTENAALQDKFLLLETELENSRKVHEAQVSQLEEDIQKAHKTCDELRAMEQRYKDKIVELEAKLNEVSQAFENALSSLQQIRVATEDEANKNQMLLQKLGEVTGKYEEMKFKNNQLLLGKSAAEDKLEEYQSLYERSLAESSGFDAKMHEHLAVIESLELELKKSQDHIKSVEEKFFISEERRLSLENKNEEMCRKMTEDSQNLITIDDLANKVVELLQSEKNWKDSVKSLEAANSELKYALDEARAEKVSLDKEIKALTEKMSETDDKVRQLRDSETEKNNTILNLTKELDKKKTENRQITVEFDKLNRDYEQFENDFKENLENSQNLEKSLKHKIEKLTGENAILLDRLNQLSENRVPAEEKTEEGESKRPKKRKSVTFRTDEVEYIKDLKKQLHVYDSNLKKANEQIETLKAELLREKLKDEVTNVLAEAQEKVENLKSLSEETLPVVESEVARTEVGCLTSEKPQQGERTFDANEFFGGQADGSMAEHSFLEEITSKSEEPVQSSDFDSLLWDDGWGTEGHLEEQYLSTRDGAAEPAPSQDYKLKISSLESEIEFLKSEIDRMSKESQDQGIKYAKALKKLKEQRITCEKLQSEIDSLKKSNSGLENLDAAIFDELKSQIENMEKKEKELLKNLEASAQERESLLKKITVLSAENEKFIEIQERRIDSSEPWLIKNKELEREITDLKERISETDLENKELLIKIEALEWNNCELSQLLEEKDELLEESRRESSASGAVKETEGKSHLQKEIEELNSVKDLLEKKLLDEERKSSAAIGELNEQLTALATENETLQDILGEMKKSADALKKRKTNESKIFDYFKSSTGYDLFPASSVTESSASESEVEALKKRVSELQELLKAAEAENKRKSEQSSEMENLIKIKQNELNTAQLLLTDFEGTKRRIAELENALKSRDSEIRESRIVASEKEIELNDLKQRLSLVQSEKEIQIDQYNRSLLEMESVLSLRSEELQQLKLKLGEKDVVSFMGNFESAGVPKHEEPTQFETIDLTEKSENSAKTEDTIEILRLRVFELESAVEAKENEIISLQTKLRERTEEDMESLMQRNAELEGILRMKEEESAQLRSVAWDRGSANSAEELKRKIQDMEEFLRFKENEFFELESVKANEIEGLNMRIFELENLVKFKESNEQGLEQTILELKNLNDEKSQRIQSEKSMEIDGMRQRVLELENILAEKNDEINELTRRSSELEKSYNDSKLEIERLLNEEKLNTEEKFVEPFQNNFQIPVAFELEALTRSLNEEKQKSENLQYELSEKRNLIQQKTAEINLLSNKIVELEEKCNDFADVESRQRIMTEESYEMKAQLERMISNLQKELENSKLELSSTRRQLQEFENVENDAISILKSQLAELETELVESSEKKDSEIMELKSELNEKTNYYEKSLRSKVEEETKTKEKVEEIEKSKMALEKEIELLNSELISKEKLILDLSQMLGSEREQLAELSKRWKERESEMSDLKQTLTHLHEEISHFRNFEKQVKELRVAQMKEASSDVPVTPEGDPDLNDWTEHELAELSTRLQSDLDTALYMLHQRDVRCDELTFELMQLIEERDTLQLRLSTALRINEELRSLGQTDTSDSGRGSRGSLQENKDLVDQSNDRQEKRIPQPSEDLVQLANKLSELHSVSYLRDKTVKDDSVHRHTEQMKLLSRISDPDVTFSRDAQSSPAVLLNWLRGKTTPKVMHI